MATDLKFDSHERRSVALPISFSSSDSPARRNMCPRMNLHDVVRFPRHTMSSTMSAVVCCAPEARPASVAKTASTANHFNMMSTTLRIADCLYQVLTESQQWHLFIQAV